MPFVYARTYNCGALLIHMEEYSTVDCAIAVIPTLHHDMRLRDCAGMRECEEMKETAYRRSDTAFDNPPLPSSL